MFKCLFYFIDSNTIDNNYKKDYCQKCGYLKYCSGYLAPLPNNISCNINSCYRIDYSFCTYNNITYDNHHHFLYFECKETQL